MRIGAPIVAGWEQMAPGDETAWLIGEQPTGAFGLNPRTGP